MSHDGRESYELLFSLQTKLKKIKSKKEFPIENKSDKEFIEIYIFFSKNYCRRKITKHVYQPVNVTVN